MGWYEAIKDGIYVAQKADNIPLVQSLLEALQQVQDLVQENIQLKDKIRKLEEIEDISSKIERHKDAYITLSDDSEKLIYCSCCWDTKCVLVQGQIISEGQYKCPSCGTKGFYDKAIYDKRQNAAMKQMGRKVINRGITTDLSL